MQNQIKEFNEKLVQDKKEITIIEYVKQLNDLFFNIDISFIDDFIDLVDKDGFIINHEMLFKYEVMTKADSYNVLRILENYNFEEGVDYALKFEGIDEGRVEKKIYMLTSDVFKMICMRSQKTKKYAQYYIVLEKCIKYYNEYEKLKLEHTIQEINKIKLLKLEKSQTLDNFVIVKCDKDTQIVTRFNNRKELRDHDSEYYPYALIKGQNRNIHSTMKECNLKVSNILVELEVPSQQNFTKRIREVLKHKFERFVRYYKLLYINGIEDRMYAEDIDDYDEEEDLKISVTRFFRINGITEQQFVDKIYEIHQTRFNN